MEGRVVREECLFSKKHRRPEASASRLSVTLCRETVFATYIPITRCRFVVCHAGTANVPRRHGRRAAPAWQTCRAGVANSKAPSAHSKVPWRNGFAPYRNECKWLRNSGGICRISPPPPAVHISFLFSTPKAAKSGDAKHGTTSCGRRRRAPTGWHTHPRGTAAWGSGGSPQPAKRPLVKECVEGSALL